MYSTHDRELMHVPTESLSWVSPHDTTSGKRRAFGARMGEWNWQKVRACREGRLLNGPFMSMSPAMRGCLITSSRR